MSKAKLSKQKAKKTNSSPASAASKSAAHSPFVPQWAAQGFVGYQNAVSQEHLKALLKQFQPAAASELTSSEPIYFLKWIHRVSGFVDSLENLPAEFPSPEGQMFTNTISFRWQQRGEQYDVLLLSPKPLEVLGDWQAIAENGRSILWETRLLPALPHGRKEDKLNPQYPNRFIYQGIQASRLCQRLFRNADTGTVHFVALEYQHP